MEERLLELQAQLCVLETERNALKNTNRSLSEQIAARNSYNPRNGQQVSVHSRICVWIKCRRVAASLTSPV